MARDTADDDLANELVAFITEEAQSFSCLVAVLVQGLVTIIRNSGVWTRVIFHCSGQIENTPVMLKGIFFKNMQQPRSSGPGLTDTLWATVTPFGCSGISAMAGDLARTLELVALVT